MKQLPRFMLYLKPFNFSFLGVLAAVLLTSSLFIPAEAQNPRLLKQKFWLNPYSEVGSGFALAPYYGTHGSSPVAIPGGSNPVAAPQVQLIPASSGATTELMVSQAGPVNFVSISVDYASSVASVFAIRPGSIFDDLVEGVDYLITTDLNRATAINPDQEMDLPLGTTPFDVTLNRRSYVDIIIFDIDEQITFQTGSLIRIDWQASNTATGKRTPFVFTRLDLKDVSGTSITPCIGPPNLSTVPTLLGVPVPNPSNPNPCYDATQKPLRLDFGDGLIIGLLEITTQPIGLTFQVALQGASTVDYHAIYHKLKDIKVTARTLNGLVPGSLLPTANGVLDGTVNVLAPLPYEYLVVERNGYLSIEVTNVDGPLQNSLVTLLAGDVDNSGVIDILDLSLMASNLNSPVAGNPLRDIMDYTGDGRVDIADIAIVSGNFRTVGPSLIAD